MKTATLALACALLGAPAGFFTACTGPTFIVQQYRGPVRPREAIGTLRVNGRDTVRLLALDDADIAVPIESDSRLHIELLPGRHTLIVANASFDAPDAALPLAFEAEGGKVYRVTFVGREPRVFEASRDADTLGRDVTAPPRVDGSRDDAIDTQ